MSSLFPPLSPSLWSSPPSPPPPPTSSSSSSVAASSSSSVAAWSPSSSAASAAAAALPTGMKRSRGVSLLLFSSAPISSRRKNKRNSSSSAAFPTGREKRSRDASSPSLSSSPFPPSSCLPSSFSSAAETLEEEAAEKESEFDVISKASMRIDAAFLKMMEENRTAEIHSCGNSFSKEEIDKLYEGRKRAHCPTCMACTGRSSYRPNLALRNVAETFFATSVGSVSLDVFNDLRALKHLREAEKYFFNGQYAEAIQECDLGLRIECGDDRIKQELIADKRKARAILADFYLDKGNNLVNCNFVLLRNQGKFSEAEKIINDAKEAYQRALDMIDCDNESKQFIILEKIGRCHGAYGICLFNQKKYPESEKAYKDAIQAYEKVLPTMNNEADKARILEQIGRCHGAYGICLFNQKKYPESEKAYKAAIQAYEKMLPTMNNEADKARILEQIGNCHFFYAEDLFNQEKYPESEKAYKDAIQAYEKMLPTMNNEADKARILEKIGKCHVVSAKALFNQKKYPESEKAYKDAIQAYEKVLPTMNNEADKARILKQIGNCHVVSARALFNQKKYLESEKAYKDAIQAYEKVLPAMNNEADKARILEQIGEGYFASAIVLCEQKKYPESEKAYKDAIQAYGDALSMMNNEADKARILEQIGKCHFIYARVLCKQEKYLKSNEAFTEGRKVYLEYLKKSDLGIKNRILIEMVRKHKLQAELYFQMKQYKSAESTVTLALDLTIDDDALKLELLCLSVNILEKIILQDKDKELADK